jgi:cell cycle checkpoint protein
MTKAMSKVLDAALTDPATRPPTSALQLIALTSNGDLRSAINSLQLLCSRERGDKGRKRKARTDMGPPKKKGKGSRGGKGAKLDVSDDLRAV